MKRALTLIAALALSYMLQAGVSVGRLFGDGMVLQQQADVPVWGKADPGSKVSVSASWGASSSARADADGAWRTSLRSPAASYKHHTLTVSSQGTTIRINDVLVGEVWIASGQSNMQITLRGFYNCPIENALEYISAPPAPDKVRMFTVPMELSYEPREELYGGQWEKSTPAGRKEMSAVAYLYAEKLNSVLDVPVGIIACPYGGAHVEGWSPREVLEQYEDIDLSREAIDAIATHYDRPMEMYNAMLYPIRGYAAKGFIWYQGCSNVGADEVFVERFANMVAAWRADWNDTGCRMPFYTVEIAPYQYKGPYQYEKAPLLRQAQHEAAHIIPNCEIVVTNDLVSEYERDNIHPSRKKPIADRLAYLALNRDYGLTDIDCYSPEAVKLVRMPASSEIGVVLTHTENGTNRWRDIEGLEVAGSEGIFYPVTYAYFEYEPQVLRIRSEFVFDPCEVRYGWGDFKPGNLANCEGLPLAPFHLKMQPED